MAYDLHTTHIGVAGITNGQTDARSVTDDIVRCVLQQTRAKPKRPTNVNMCRERCVVSVATATGFIAECPIMRQISWYSS